MGNNSGKILIIDPDENMLDVLKETLESYDFNVDITSNSAEALELFKKDEHWVLVLSYPMFDIEKIDFLNEIKLSLDSLFSVIIMGSEYDDTIAKEFINIGVNYFINKPIKKLELVGAVKGAYETQQYKRQIIESDKNYEILGQTKTENLETEIKAHKLLQNKLKATVEETRIAKKEIEEANKAKSYFLANMSHEIRTPINAIIGFTDLLASSIKNKNEKHYVSSIIKSSENLLLIINDILDITKIEADKMIIKPKKLDIFDLFNEMKNIFSIKIDEKKLRFIIEIDEKIPTEILIDEVRLRQILFNLIGNSIKFTDKGYVKLYARSQNVSTKENQFDFIFGVEDTGIGVDKTHQNKIFKTFYQKESKDFRKYGGTGLGLSITKRLIEMMNGTITLESEVNKGSKFEVVFKEVSISSYNLLNNKSSFSLISSESFNFDSDDSFLDEIVNGDISAEETAWKNELIEMYKNVKKNHYIPDLTIFADRINEISKDNDIVELEFFSDELKQQIEVFDIRNINNSLEDFPRFLKG